MRFYWFVLGVLCVWRLTHLLAAEDGPGQILVRLRRIVGQGIWGDLLDCFYCLSLWIAAPVSLLIARGWMERLMLWLALSAGAILLERATNKERPSHADESTDHGQQPPPAIYSEDEGDENGVLRKSTTELPKSGSDSL